MSTDQRWTPADEDLLRAALAALREEAAATPLPEAAFVRARGDRRRRRRALALTGSVAAAVVLVAAVGFGVLGPGHDDAHQPVPGGRSTAAVPTGSPTSGGPATDRPLMSVRSAMPLGAEWQADVTGTQPVPIVQAQPSHDQAGLGCLTPTGATLVDDQRIVGDRTRPDATLLGTQTRWSFADARTARTALTELAGQLRSQCHLPGLTVTSPAGAAGALTWRWDPPSGGTAYLGLATGGRDVGLVDASAGGRAAARSWGTFVELLRSRLERYGTAG